MIVVSYCCWCFFYNLRSQDMNTLQSRKAKEIREAVKTKVFLNKQLSLRDKFRYVLILG